MSGHCLRYSIPHTNTSILGAVIPPLRDSRPCQNKSRCCFSNFWNHVHFALLQPPPLCENNTRCCFRQRLKLYCCLCRYGTRKRNHSAKIDRIAVKRKPFADTKTCNVDMQYGTRIGRHATFKNLSYPPPEHTQNCPSHAHTGCGGGHIAHASLQDIKMKRTHPVSLHISPSMFLVSSVRGGIFEPSLFTPPPHKPRHAAAAKAVSFPSAHCCTAADTHNAHRVRNRFYLLIG